MQRSLFSAKCFYSQYSNTGGTSVYMQTSVIYKNILPSYTWKYVSGMSLKILNINFCKRGALRNTRTFRD